MIDNIDLSNSLQYKLSIRLSSDGFSFSITDPNCDNNFLFSSFDVSSGCSMSVNVKEMLSSTEYFKRKYKKVDVIVDSSRFTIVPSELIDESKLEDIIYYNFQRISNEEVFLNKLNKSGEVIIFGFDKHAIQFLKEHFHDINVICSVASIADYFSQKSAICSNKRMYVDICQDNMKVFCYDNNKLLLINRYSCKENSDRIYYLLYIWKNLGFNKEKDFIILNGNVRRKDEMIKELQTFVPHVFNFLPKAEFNRSAISKIEALPFDMQTLLYASN